MKNIEKKNLLVKIQDFLESKRGKSILNYSYSWGAAIVILGALFKLTHIEGANLMLFIGMGTEVLVFFISGFERPFMQNWNSKDEDNSSVLVSTSGSYINKRVPASSSESNDFTDIIETQVQDLTVKSRLSTEKLDIVDVETITQEYIDQVRNLTEKLILVTKQSELMERNTEEIDALGRNMISLNTFYQMHLRSASSQMDNIDLVNVQTKKMLEQIEELNRVYARMVEAMKVNVQNAPTGE
ncbi:MAG TPA: gliding motility protein GldL [Bacteroidaceae bacterium]|nr:gliding motility protein GldL [Bacteroidaceae bacterium]